MRIRLLLLLVCCVSAIGLVVSGSSLYTSRQASARGAEIAQPSQWVSFEATTTRIANGQVIAGRVFRGADGSEYYVESGENPISLHVTIHHISNYTKGVYYHSSKPQEWTSGPLAVSAGRRKMRQFFADYAGLRKYRAKLALWAGQDGSLESSDGLDAWISTTAEGSVHLLAPQLNFFPVVSNMLNGQRRVVSDIRLRPVAESYFEPPPGDQVTVLSETFPSTGRQ